MKLCNCIRPVRGVQVVFWFIAAVGTANGQHSQHKAASSIMGSLSRRVFAITKAGDLKPARMADVYILYASGVARDGKSVDVGETAELVFMEEQNHAQALYVGEIGKNPNGQKGKRACMIWLLFAPQ